MVSACPSVTYSFQRKRKFFQRTFPFALSEDRPLRVVVKVLERQCGFTGILRRVVDVSRRVANGSAFDDRCQLPPVELEDVADSEAVADVPARDQVSDVDAVVKRGRVVHVVHILVAANLAGVICGDVNVLTTCLDIEPKCHGPPIT